MGFIRKIFGAAAGEGKAESPAEQDSPESGGSETQTREREAPRRELLHKVLRETMQQNGIPSDWIGCRVLSVTNSKNKAGAHAQFIVRKGDEQLLAYVHQFQDFFWRELQRIDPHARQWLFSVAWQFDGQSPASGTTFSAQPGRVADILPGRDPLAFDLAATLEEAGDTLPADDGDAVDLESDLAALQAAISNPAALEPESGTASRRPR